MTNDLTIIQPDSDLLAALGGFMRLNVADGDASSHTVASYLTEVKQYTLWCADNDLNPAYATENDIREYRSYLIDRYKLSTVGTKLAVIRRLYDAACWRGLRLDNPARGIKAPKDRTAQEDKVKYLPLDGFRRMLSIAPADTPIGKRDRAIIGLMGWHGLRVNECRTLKIDSLDLTTGVLTVVGKGGKVRKVYLIDRSLGPLLTWLEIRPLWANPDTDALFTDFGNRTMGQPMTTRGIRYMIDGYLIEAGLKAEGISCHSLRHSFATWSLAGGANLQVISGAMGHSKTATTEIYAKIVDRMKENPALYLAGVIGE